MNTWNAPCEMGTHHFRSSSGHKRILTVYVAPVPTVDLTAPDPLTLTVDDPIEQLAILLSLVSCLSSRKHSLSRRLGQLVQDGGVSELKQQSPLASWLVGVVARGVSTTIENWVLTNTACRDHTPSVATLTMELTFSSTRSNAPAI